MSLPTVGQIITTTANRLGVNGEGVAKLDNLTLFVDGVLPGEVFEGKITEVKPRFARAELLKVKTDSPDRVEAPCPLAQRCGGCQVMPLSYSAQLNEKRSRVVDALVRIGKLEGISVEPCLPSPEQLAYRNKVTMPIQVSNGQLKVGYYARSSHDLIDVPKCYIHNPVGEKALAIFRKSLGAAPQTLQGHLAMVTIKSSVSSDSALIVLSTQPGRPKELVDFAASLIQGPIKGVVQEINDTYHTLSGESTIDETLSGLTFAISAASFFQVNPSQAENLYQTVISLSEVKPTDTILDAYCGVGTLSLFFAQKAKKVTGIEIVPSAIDNARKNAQRNKITNATFVCAKFEKWAMKATPHEILVLNPPRQGCDRDIFLQLPRIRPKKIVYVSCDPATLARDLSILTQLNYKIKMVQPLDMFPQTAHVETVVILTAS